MVVVERRQAATTPLKRLQLRIPKRKVGMQDLLTLRPCHEPLAEVFLKRLLDHSHPMGPKKVRLAKGRLGKQRAAMLQPRAKSWYGAVKQTCQFRVP